MPNVFRQLATYNAGFTRRAMMRLGLPLTVIIYGSILFFMFSYWPRVGHWK